MQITAHIQHPDADLTLVFNETETQIAALAASRFFDYLTGVPVAEPKPKPLAIEVTEGQKEASGTPRRSRTKKAAEEPAAPLVTPTATVEWADGSKSAAEVLDVREDGMTAIAYTDPDGQGSGHAVVPSVQVYDLTGQPIPPETPAVDVLETPAPPPAPTYITAEQKAEVEALFKAAGMAPYKAHSFLVNQYPGVPVTVGTLTDDQYRGLVPILKGKVRDAEPVADEPPPPDAPVVDEAQEPIDWNEPAAEADPLVTETEADEVRTAANKFAPADARAILKKHFGIVTPEALTRSQARQLIDVHFPAALTETEEIPF